MPIRWAYLKRVLAGAVFGLYIAHLLYFLNPQVDATPGRLAAVTIFYGLLCGLLFGTALWLLRLLRVRIVGEPVADGPFRAHGFGFVVLAAFVSATIYWMQRIVFGIYLPIGAQRFLAKATNLITVTAFILLLLWLAERNAGRKRSRAIFIAGVLLIAISSFLLSERRDNYRTEKQRIVVADVGTVAGRRPVILVAVRNLPYDWILTLSGEGSLPFFDEARRRAYFTRLEPFPTVSSNALWASLATGKLPFRHGVTGQFSYRTPLNDKDPTERFLVLPSGIGFNAWALVPPVQRISAQLPSGDSLPIWTVFERLGLHAAVIRWPNNVPEVVPPSLAAEAQQFAQAPGPALQRFAGAGNARERILRGLTTDFLTLAELRAAAADKRVALSIGVLGGFEQAQRAVHIFTNELPPRSNIKGEVVRAYAEQIDAMLAALARQYPDHLLIVVSPSAPVAPRLPATPFALVRDFIISDDPGADDGFVLISGPGMVHRERPPSAQVVDIVPTLLYAAGLPVGRDMDGRVLTDAFDDETLRTNALTLVQTYEADQLLVRRGGA